MANLQVPSEVAEVPEIARLQTGRPDRPWGLAILGLKNPNGIPYPKPRVGPRPAGLPWVESSRGPTPTALRREEDAASVSRRALPSGGPVDRTFPGFAELLEVGLAALRQVLAREAGRRMVSGRRTGSFQEMGMMVS